MPVPCPDIDVYRIEAGHRAAYFLARYVIPVHNRNTGVDWLPMIFEGSTQATVFNAAVDFWNDEQTKLADHAARMSALAESRRKATL